MSKKIKFKSKGRWADPKDPRIPIIEVEADSEHVVSDALAESVIEAGKGSYVHDVQSEKTNPAQDDKKQADKGTSRGRGK